MTTYAEMVTEKREAVWESWHLRAEAVVELGGPAAGWAASAICPRSGVDFESYADEPAALALCERCPVRLACLAATIIEEAETPVRARVGVRGGVPARARRTPWKRPRPDCGTVPGYHYHHSHGEVTDQRCRDAYARSIDPARRAARRAAARAAKAAATAQGSLFATDGSR